MGALVGLLSVVFAVTMLLMIKKGIWFNKSSISSVNPSTNPMGYDNHPNFGQPPRGSSVRSDLIYLFSRRSAEHNYACNRNTVNITQSMLSTATSPM